MAGTKERARYYIQQGRILQRRQRLARIPLTKDEVKEAGRIWYESGELAGIGMLGVRGSVSAMGYLKLGLTRDILREALAKTGGSRILQTTLCRIP